MKIPLGPETSQTLNDLIAPITQAWGDYEIVEVILNPSSFPVNEPDRIILNVKIEARRKR